ncbi:hypothetical protein MKW98_013944 [Papaver atlanticum]|uniref:Uncharacterized protein n=1 Tax=Papaver atlanticum TaxID=357466 RepID=A0AAD4SIJ7_9MAGN|nr:hypothetical protein MKW98_013944 [Papaver atlanticum]
MSAITPTNPQAKKSSSSDPISRRANLGQKLVPPEAEVNISVLEHKDEFYSPAFLFEESSSSDPISRRANLVPPEAVIRLLPAKGCEEVDDVYFPGYFSEEDASCVPPVLNPADKVNPSDEVDEVDNAVIRLSSSSDPISRRANLVPPEAVIGLLPAKGCDIEEDASCIPPVLNPADKLILPLSNSSQQKDVIMRRWTRFTFQASSLRRMLLSFLLTSILLMRPIPLISNQMVWSL